MLTKTEQQSNYFPYDILDGGSPVDVRGINAGLAACRT